MSLYRQWISVMWGWLNVAFLNYYKFMYDNILLANLDQGIDISVRFQEFNLSSLSLKKGKVMFSKD